MTPKDGGTIDAPMSMIDAGPLPAYQLIGRWDTSDPIGPKAAWPGSAILFRVTGPTIAIQLEDQNGQNEYDLTIDGVAQPTFTPMAGMNTYMLATGLTNADHDVQLTRRTESFFGITRIVGFPGESLPGTPAPPSAARMIEFIGDSITCGYGILGVGPTCSFDATTESEPAAWGALAAAQLGASHAAIAYSGKGVYRNNGGDMSDLMPSLWLRTIADDPPSVYPFTSYTPDVVVIDLGTNDFAGGDPGQPFVDAYDAFVQAIRAKYPDAHIVIAMSPMLSDGFPAGAMERTKAIAYLQQVVAHGGANVTYLDLAEQDPADGYGCDYHPSQATAQKMSTALVAHIHTITGW
jgi:lysophospholipase L1-like esterase